MPTINFKEKLEKLFKKEECFLDENNEVDYIKFKNNANKIDSKLIEILISDKEAKNKFFTKIKDVFVFNINDFKFFLEENKVNNSYTQYKNRIGLTDGKKFLKDTNDVILDFPYKDCVLEGGQSTEEGMDVYFEYDDTVTKKQEKQGFKAGSYNQKTAKRKEIFFNSILAHDEIDRLFDAKALINWKRFSKDGEQKVKEIKRGKDGTIKENLIIKGNNLLALHSLKKQFAEKVKLIYIDPPYNTGNDGFKYNDNFNHSAWLAFMKNRLEVAKDLLRDDGVIFVQCDDNEQAYLKVLMDEIKEFHEEVTLYIQVRYEGKSLTEKNDYQKLIEHIFVYSKKTFKPIKDEEEYLTDKFCWEIEELSRGKKVKIGHRDVTIFKKGAYKITKNESIKNGLKETWASGTVLKNNASGKYFGDYLAPRVENDGLEVLYKVKGIGEDGLGYRYFTGPKREGATKGKFYSGIPLKRIEEMKNGKAIKLKSIANFYNFADSFGNCRHEGGVELRSGKKPEVLLKRILEISTNERDIVLDFHIGTGVTCAVAHKMKRQYIGIEQLDYAENDSVIRLQNVINGDRSGISDYEDVKWQGGGDFIYFELAKWNETAKEKILACESLEELIKFFDEMYERYFLNYNLKIKDFREKVIKEEEFKGLSLDEQKKMFVAMLDNNQMYVNESEMEDKKFKVDKKDIVLTKEFYNNK